MAETEENQNTEKPPSTRWSSPRERARSMRRKMNRQELALWESLRCKRFLGLTFRRKHLVLRFFDRRTGTEGAYISDFYCHKVRLAVEVDGINTPASHARDAVLKANGIHVLRFTRDEIERDRGAVLYSIRGFLTGRGTRP